MTTQTNTSAYPDLIFGPSDGNEGFKVLHKRNGLSSEHIRSFESSCRGISWAATKEPPEKLHALVFLRSKDTLLLLHVRQQLDDKNRRALRVDGYLYSESSHGDLIRKAQSLARDYGMRLVGSADKIVTDKDGVAMLTKTDLLGIGASQIKGNLAPKKKLPAPERPKNLPTPDQGDLPPVKSNKSIMKIVFSLIVGLIIGVLGSYFTAIDPLNKEKEISITENDSLKIKNDSLTSEISTLRGKLEESGSELASTNDQIATLKNDYNELRRGFSEEDLKIKEILKNEKDRKDMANQLSRQAAKLTALAEKQTKMARELREGESESMLDTITQSFK